MKTREGGRVRTLRHGSGTLAMMLVLGCGPTITLDEPDDAESGEPTAAPGPTTGRPSTTTITTSPTITTAVTTSGADADSTNADSGPVFEDFPEHCSIFTQDCPAGYKCAPCASDGGSAWNDSCCVPIADEPAGVGEVCEMFGSAASGLDDCELGAMCWDVDLETNQGVCIPLCKGSPEDAYCDEPCMNCVIINNGALPICLDVCDPITQSCPDGQGCFLVEDSFSCAPDAGSDASTGDPCEFVNVCNPGLACIEASLLPDCQGAWGCCSPFCTVGGRDACPEVLPGTACMPIFDPGQEPPERCVTGPIGVCQG